VPFKLHQWLASKESTATFFPSTSASIPFLMSSAPPSTTFCKLSPPTQACSFLARRFSFQPPPHSFTLFFSPILHILVHHILDHWQMKSFQRRLLVSCNPAGDAGGGLWRRLDSNCEVNSIWGRRGVSPLQVKKMYSVRRPPGKVDSASRRIVILLSTIVILRRPSGCVIPYNQNSRPSSSNPFFKIRCHGPKYYLPFFDRCE